MDMGMSLLVTTTVGLAPVPIMLRRISVPPARDAFTTDSAAAKLGGAA